MRGDTLLVEALINAGCSPKQATAFERWIEDTRPVGIGCLMLEKAITRTVLMDTTKYAAALEGLSRLNRELEQKLAMVEGANNRFLFEV